MGAKFIRTVSLCSFCKHNMHLHIESCHYLLILMFKTLGKVVANKLCVMVCKPNDIDDIGCI